MPIELLQKQKDASFVHREHFGTNGRVVLPFRYPGGKYYALSALRKFWEAAPHDEYREPFVGGGSVFFAKPKVQSNWINDIDRELINTYKIIADQKASETLIDLVSHEEASKERWKEVREFNPTTDLERAFKYFYMNRTSFSGKMISPAWGYRPKRSYPPERWHEKIRPSSTKLRNVRITCQDFEKVISAPSNQSKVLLFIDPPYFKPPKRKHYSQGFVLEDHLRLASCLRNTKYQFILTYEDAQEIRELYSWARLYELEFFYRVDNSSENGDAVPTGSRRKGSELVITNFTV